MLISVKGTKRKVSFRCCTIELYNLTNTATTIYRRLKLLEYKPTVHIYKGFYEAFVGSDESTKAIFKSMHRNEKHLVKKPNVIGLPRCIFVGGDIWDTLHEKFTHGVITEEAYLECLSKPKMIVITKGERYHSVEVLYLEEGKQLLTIKNAKMVVKNMPILY